MGDTLWTGHNVVVSWHTGPERADGGNRLIFTVTNRAMAVIDAPQSAVTLTSEQWRALAEWIEPDAFVPGLDTPPGR